MKKTIATFLCLFIALISKSQIISTIAGTTFGGYSGDGGAATSAELQGPVALAMDKHGNLYVTDAYNNVVRKISQSGIITTVAGNTIPSYSGDGGQATAAELYHPTGICVDTNDMVYVTDCYNYRIRMINTSGIITTVVGNGIGGFSGNGGPATAAEIAAGGIAVTDSGTLYIADCSNNCVRKVNRAGIINTVIGTGGYGFSGDGGPATAAQLMECNDITFDLAGNIYVSDFGNSRIRKINTSGIISTFAGNGSLGRTGDGGPATAAEITYPQGVCMDKLSGKLYISVSDDVVRMVNASGIISTFAGSGIPGYSGNGGPALAAELQAPSGLAVDNLQNIYFADDSNNCIRKVNTAPLGYKEITNVNSNSIYPNPNNGVLNLEIPVDELNSCVEFYNILGKKVYSGKLASKINSVNISNQPSGIYLYRVISENGNVVGEGKFVIEK